MGLLRLQLKIANQLKFPSVKAQELLLLVSEFAEIRASKPDLFDPGLDEKERNYEFSLDTAFSQEELGAKIAQAFEGDSEIESFSLHAPAAAKPAVTEEAPRSAARQLRVDSRRLEELGRLAGELVILKEQVASAAAYLSRFPKSPELSDLGKTLRRSVQGLHDVAGQIQDRTREFQRVPIGSMLQRFQRIARDTSRKLGKKIECDIEGAETEVDGNLLDRLGDLLVHLVRNCADHGIESPEERRKAGKPECGRIRLEAYHEEDQLVIEVSDDGAGIDPRKIAAKAVKLGLLDEQSAKSIPSEELIRFIFRAGFSTSNSVSDVSGRGVGLDVVKSRVEEMNGLLDLRTEVGQGSTFLIRVPLSLSIVQALLVEGGGEIFALPLASVLRVLRFRREEIPERTGEGELQLPDGRLRVFDLAEVLGNRGAKLSQEEEDRFLVELGYGVERYGLFVKKVLGRREIVIRALGRIPGKIPGIVGVATLGDGKIVVVLDPRFLAERSTSAKELSQ